MASHKTDFLCPFDKYPQNMSCTKKWVPLPFQLVPTGSPRSKRNWELLLCNRNIITVYRTEMVKNVKNKPQFYTRRKGKNFWCLLLHTFDPLITTTNLIISVIQQRLSLVSLGYLCLCPAIPLTIILKRFLGRPEKKYHKLLCSFSLQYLLSSTLDSFTNTVFSVFFHVVA